MSTDVRKSCLVQTTSPYPKSKRLSAIVRSHQAAPQTTSRIPWRSQDRPNRTPLLMQQSNPRAVSPNIRYNLRAVNESIGLLQRLGGQMPEKLSRESRQALANEMSRLAQVLNRSANAMNATETNLPDSSFYQNHADKNNRQPDIDNTARTSITTLPYRSSIQFETFQVPDADEFRKVNGAIKPSIAPSFTPPTDKPLGKASAPVDYPEQVTVEVKIVFLRVLDINTVCQYFESEVYIQARWTERQFAGFSEKELETIEFCQCWDPRLKILNIIGVLDVNSLSMLLRYEEDRIYPVLSLIWHVQGLFKENLELQHFPFDVQELSIALSSERAAREIELISDTFYPSGVLLGAMRESPEWTVYQHVEFERDFANFELLSSTRYPILVMSAHVQRKLGFYFWNVAVIVFLILGLSLTLLAQDPVSCNRMGLVTTLFLTAVAFKLVVKTTLPTISYLTYLDIYVVFTLMYLATQAAESAIMCHLGRFKRKEKVALYDEIAQTILVSLLVIFHLIFIFYILSTAFKRRRLMTKKDQEHRLKKKSKEPPVKKGIDDKVAAERPYAGSRRPTHVVYKDAEMSFENPLFDNVQTQTSTCYVPGASLEFYTDPVPLEQPVPTDVPDLPEQPAIPAEPQITENAVV